MILKTKYKISLYAAPFNASVCVGGCTGVYGGVWGMCGWMGGVNTIKQ